MGGGTFQLQSVSSGVTCQGIADATEISFVSCTGQRGNMPMTCSDGRIFTGDWRATSCTSGVGDGADQNGKSFRFVFGLTDRELQDALKQ